MSKRFKDAPYSLRRRLTISMVTGFLVILAVIAIALWNYAVTAANRTYDLLLEGAAISILERITSSESGVAVDFPPAALEILGLAENDRVFYRIYDSSGETLTGDSDLPLPAKSSPFPQPQYFDAPYSGTTVRFVRFGKVVAGADFSDRIFVQVGQTRLAREDLKYDLFFRGMLVLIGLVLAGVVFARIAVNLALRPLSGIAGELQARDPTDLAPLRVSPPREIIGLIRALNGFMRRLGANRDNAQAFIADVAHQIRTSLSALKGQLELAQERQAPEEVTQALTKANDQARKTINLTNQLLAHAMVIHRADAQIHAQVDLVELIASSIEDHVKLQRGADIDYEVDQSAMPEDCKIVGDAVSLREALRNLIDNAAAHAGPAPYLRIAIEPSKQDKDEIALIVEDNGPGIAPRDRAKALERFSSLGENPGSGLGLAIVKAVVEAHQGSILLTDRIGGGLRVELSLPKAKGPTP